MTHFALVSKADPVELPKVDASGKKKNVREEVTLIYESYAALYPNPRLGEEAHERGVAGVRRAVGVRQQRRALRRCPHPGARFSSWRRAALRLGSGGGG